MMDKPHTKHEASKGKYNGHIEKGNKREKESWQKQADRTTQGRVKARQGQMGCHTKRTNWRRQSRRNGKYETTMDALNPHLWCINHIGKEASSTSFMASRYNTRAQKQLVYSRKENREREIAARMNRVRSQSSLKPFKLSKCSKTPLWHHQSSQNQARQLDQPGFRLGHEDHWKKTSSNHRRSLILTKSHHQRKSQ
jgi:hypothetical protein